MSSGLTMKGLVAMAKGSEDIYLRLRHMYPSNDTAFDRTISELGPSVLFAHSIASLLADYKDPEILQLIQNQFETLHDLLQRVEDYSYPYLQTHSSVRAVRNTLRVSQFEEFTHEAHDLRLQLDRVSVLIRDLPPGATGNAFEPIDDDDQSSDTRVSVAASIFQPEQGELQCFLIKIREGSISIMDEFAIGFATEDLSQTKLEEFKDEEPPEDEVLTLVIFCRSGQSTEINDLTLPMSPKIFQHLVVELGIQPRFASAIQRNTAQCFYWPSEKGQGMESMVHKATTPTFRKPQSWAFSHSYNSKQNKSCLFVLGFQEDSLHEIVNNFRRNIDVIDRQRSHADHPKRCTRHPLLMHLFIARSIAQRDELSVRSLGQELYQVEKSTRTFIWDEEATNTAELDIDAITKNLNHIIARMTFYEARLSCSLAMFNQTLKFVDRFPSAYKEEDEALKNFIGSLSEELSALLKSIAASQAVASSQVDMVYNMLSQLANQINRKMTEYNTNLTQASVRIAEASKVDSSAMKTLALLSTLFLPGTFISALFSMTFFNWAAPPGDSVVSSRFWIYWVVAVPVTFMTVVAWYFFLDVRIRETAHENTWHEYMGPETSFQNLKRRRTAKNLAEIDLTHDGEGRIPKPPRVPTLRSVFNGANGRVQDVEK